MVIIMHVGVYSRRCCRSYHHQKISTRSIIWRLVSQVMVATHHIDQQHIDTEHEGLIDTEHHHSRHSLSLRHNKADYLTHSHTPNKTTHVLSLSKWPQSSYHHKGNESFFFFHARKSTARTCERANERTSGLVSVTNSCTPFLTFPLLLFIHMSVCVFMSVCLHACVFCLSCCLSSS